VFQMLRKGRIVLKPPKGCLREHEVLRAPCLQRFQVCDRRGAVNRIIAGVRTIISTRKVPTTSISKLEKLFIAFGNDGDGCAPWGANLNRGADALNELLVVGAFALKVLTSITLANRRTNVPLLACAFRG